MKCIIKSLFGKCRLGILSEIGHHRNKLWTTPMCIVYTKGGCIPHLTLDNLKNISSDDLPLQLPLAYLAENVEVLEEFKAGIGKFIGMQDSITYVCIQDPASPTPIGYNDKKGVAVWTRGGKITLEPDSFMRVMEAAHPDVYQIICDSDTQLKSSNKRIHKATDRSLAFLDKCLEMHLKSQVLKDVACLGSIQGGYDLAERVRSAQETCKRDVHGFVIEGFHNFGPETESIRFEDIKVLLEQTLKELPADKPRVIQGAWRPDHVIKLVECGIDIFDSSYPYVLSERGSALVFDLDYEKTSPEKDDKKKQEILNIEIDMKDKRYFSDFSPVLESCKCYTCRNYTKAYVQHLLVTQELLAGILLMLHNSYHWLQFFQAIRTALENGHFEALKDKILLHQPRSVTNNEVNS